MVTNVTHTHTHTTHKHRHAHTHILHKDCRQMKKLCLQCNLHVKCLAIRKMSTHQKKKKTAIKFLSTSGVNLRMLCGVARYVQET